MHHLSFFLQLYFKYFLGVDFDFNYRFCYSKFILPHFSNDSEKYNQVGIYFDFFINNKTIKESWKSKNISNKVSIFQILNKLFRIQLEFLTSSKEYHRSKFIAAPNLNDYIECRYYHILTLFDLHNTQQINRTPFLNFSGCATGLGQETCFVQPIISI